MMHQHLRSIPSLTIFVLIAGACSSAPEPQFDPELESQIKAKRADAALIQARQQEFKRVINDMNKWIDAYVLAVLNSGAPKSDDRAQKMEQHIRSWIGPPEFVYFNEFLAEAGKTEFPRNRAIALAALGFSARREALDPLLNALGDDNREVVSNAVLGLSILKDSRTPPSYLARIIKDADREPVMRGGAAWSLYQIQVASSEVEPFSKVWVEILSVPLQDAVPSVAVSALRGLGRTRDASHAKTVERYVSHPVPKVRESAAIAIGRLGNQESFEALLALIGPAESIANVRLAANKALKALAGGVDVGYDVDQWRAVFERG